MASSIFSHLQKLWPFSILINDLSLSSLLVRRLSIPVQTKQFVLAVREPESNALVYILAVQTFSQQSAFDAEKLIKVVKPKAVVAEIAPSGVTEIPTEGNNLTYDQDIRIPTSFLGVLKGCLINKINIEEYHRLARLHVLREIFGIGEYGHITAAKRAALESDSCFVLLGSPYHHACDGKDTAIAGEKLSDLNLKAICLLPSNERPSIYPSSQRLSVTDTHQSKVKSLIPSLQLLFQKTSLPVSSSAIKVGEYEAPQPFGAAFYSFLAGFHEMFNDLPVIRNALVSAQKMLVSINKGEAVDTQLLSEVHSFRIAIEGVRIAHNNEARCSINEMNNGKLGTGVMFCDLPDDEKRHALFAHVIRSQAKKFGGSIVAIVEAKNLAGLRRHWRTSIPTEISNNLDNDDDEEIVTEQRAGKKSLLKDKPIVAVGAGATVLIGSSSLSKAFPASTLIKMASYKVPSILKFGLANLKRQAYVGLGNMFGPIKLAKACTTTTKLTGSSEMIRMVVYSMIASAEKTSFRAIGASFYEIMRQRKMQAFRFAPWTTLGCGVVAGVGLLAYEDEIGCAVESAPWAPKIATLGRGLQKLDQASQDARKMSSLRIQRSIQALANMMRN